MKDHCVVCNRVTMYDTETPVDERINYVEGVGQTCGRCYTGTYNGSVVKEKDGRICLPNAVIRRIPNNWELGELVRSLYLSNND